MKKYDIALIESDGCLTKDSYNALADMVGGERMIPIEIEATHVECSAMGFISEKAADQLDFDYDGLRRYLGRIMDDINLENPEYTYEYEGLSIYMGYEKVLLEEAAQAKSPDACLPEEKDDIYVIRITEKLAGFFNVKAPSAEAAEDFIHDKYYDALDSVSYALEVSELIDTNIECVGLAKEVYKDDLYVRTDFDATEEESREAASIEDENDKEI